MNRSELSKALADTPEPTSGYLYGELVSWTSADYATQASLLNALFAELKPAASVHVLYKALHIIRVLCECGHPDFQKSVMQKERMSALQSLVGYRGAHSASYGDALNEKVRQEARLAISSAFTPQARGSSAGLAGGGGGGGTRFGGLGSSSHTVDQSKAGGDAMEYGRNPGDTRANIADMPQGNKWADHMAKMAAKGGEAGGSQGFLQQLASTARAGFKLLKEHEQLSTLHDRTAAKQYATFANAQSSSTGAFQPVYVPNVVEPSGQSDAATTMSNIGPELTIAHPSSGSAPRISTPSVPPPAGQASASAAASGGGGSAFSFIGGGGVSTPQMGSPSPPAQQPQQSPLAPQRSAVQCHVWKCVSSRTTPQRVELGEFLQRCWGLVPVDDGGAGVTLGLGAALSEHLRISQPWQRRLNALTCVEAVLKSSGTSAASEVCRRDVEEYLRAHPAGVRRNVQVVQTSLRERATRVLEILGLSATVVEEVEEGVHPVTASAPSSRTAGQQLEDLFGDAPSSVTTTVASASSAGGSAMDLAGMEIRSGPAHTRRVGTGGEGTSGKPRRAPMRPVSNNEDGSGDLFLGSQHTHIAQPTNTASAASLDALFGTPSPAPPPQSAGDNSLYTPDNAVTAVAIWEVQLRLQEQIQLVHSDPSPTALVELKHLVNEQQQMAQAWQTAVPSSLAMTGLPEGDEVSSPVAAHSRFLVGTERTRGSEEQHANRQFANVQAEMRSRFTGS